MHFLVIYRDKPDHVGVRLANRAAHLAWVAANRATILLGGPILAEDGETMIGSMFVGEAASAGALRAFVAEDPYAKAGLFAEVEIHPWRWLVGRPEAA